MGNQRKIVVVLAFFFVCLLLGCFFFFACFVVVCFNNLKHLKCLVLKKFNTDSGVVCHTYLLDLRLDLPM